MCVRSLIVAFILIKAKYWKQLKDHLQWGNTYVNYSAVIHLMYVVLFFLSKSRFFEGYTHSIDGTWAISEGRRCPLHSFKMKYNHISMWSNS